MPADPLQPFAPGQISPLAASAATGNAVLDAARAVRRRQQGPKGGGWEVDPLRATLEVLVRNDTSSTLGVFDVVALGTPVISAADYPHEFQRQPVFPATAPAAATDAFAVLAEPIPRGDIGRAVVLGVTPVDLAVTDAGHACAKPAAGVTATLASADDGPARVIWKEAGTGTKRAVVLLGRDTSSVVNVYGETVVSVPVAITSSYQDIAGPTIPSFGIYLVWAVMRVELKCSALATGPAGAYVDGGVARNSTKLAGGYESVDVTGVLRRASLTSIDVNTFYGGDVVNFTVARESSATWTTCNVVDGMIGYYRLPG